MTTELTTTVTRHLDVLCSQIGARPGGTPANRAAAEYIAAEMRRLGLEVELQPLVCPNWRCLGKSLTLDGQPLEVLIRHFIQARFVRPRIRVWQNDNFYQTIERSIRNQQEVQKILRGKQRKNQADKG